MKAIHLFMFFLILLPLELISCESAVNNPEEYSAGYVETETPAQIAAVRSAVSTPDLTPAEIAGLMLMREEEKMAKDVYTYFYSQFKYLIFNNISKSEMVHSEAVLRVINYYKLTDPATKVTGTFTDAHLQELYTKFTTEAKTVEDALKTGAFIEEYDIADLKKLIDETDNTYIKRVYTNLKRGSENHLRAFTRTLKFRGIVYVPVILPEEEYLAIINK